MTKGFILIIFKPMFYKASSIAIFIFFVLIGCKKEDSETCTNCSSDQTPSFEVCRNSSGNAVVNGEDTGTDFDVYIQGLKDAGASCGGG